VAWEVWEEKNPALSAERVERACLAEGVAGLPYDLVLHGDNGPTLKAETLDAFFAQPVDQTFAFAAQSEQRQRARRGADPRRKITSRPASGRLRAARGGLSLGR